MFDKQHYTFDGIFKLKEMKSNVNRARSFEDKFNFCLSNDIKLTLGWIQEFIDGEGSFQCEIIKSKRGLIYF